MAAQTMVMGDLVLTENEVAPVMAKLQEAGIEITALHNHVLNESPRVMYMHISAHGDALKLAQSINAALQLSKTPLIVAAAAQPEQLNLDMKQLDQIFGRTGKVNGGVYQFAIPRAEKIVDGNMNNESEPIPSSMGLATAINFQPTGSGRAAVTGDFVLIASEVNLVIAALRASGITVTALHSHMLNDSPHLFFMHFWANDDSLKLARGLRSALDRTNSAK
jgi:biotin operon repressor